MAALTFTKDTVNNYWVAEETVNTDFNVHVECVESGYLRVEVGTVSGANKMTKYETRAGYLVDWDFHGAVYPKYIKVVSYKEPTSGSCFLTEAE